MFRPNVYLFIGGILSASFHMRAATQQLVDPFDVITTRARVFNSPPVVVQMGVILSSVGTLPYDYYKMGPAINMAVERALRDYNIRFNLILSIYDGDCSETGALGQNRYSHCR
ncbi:hypothetical protein BV898_08157 [Hypsibius exemplaris]|uniref:Uncharacterized protein n=1 Tax=Hypsibius exemplaris TaxID=2072580 RepID=A0A1W0WR76_HYPEX|nr:hypothetical protein BV898_08157 [Hypsibius exemplaris]